LSKAFNKHCILFKERQARSCPPSIYRREDSDVDVRREPKNEEAVAAILAGSAEKKRNFVETIEIQFMLKNYDPARDKRFSGTLKLPFVPRPRYKVCILGDAKHCDMAKAEGIPCMDVEALKALAAAPGGVAASGAVLDEEAKTLTVPANARTRFPSCPVELAIDLGSWEAPHSRDSFRQKGSDRSFEAGFCSFDIILTEWMHDRRAGWKTRLR